MRVFHTVLIVGLIVVAQTRLAQADPGDIVKKFINEPVSLFSLGIDKLRDRMDGLAKTSMFMVDGKPVPYSSGGANYDWDKNQINLFITRYTQADEDPPQLETECKESINRMRLVAGVNVDTGKPFGGGDSSSFFSADFFPSGYSMKNLTDEDARNFDAIINLQVRIQNLSKITHLLCSAPLLGTGYSVEK